MNSALERSYRLCQQEARRSGSNFYYSFFLLPAAKRRAMAALYAFMRRTDDLGDDSDVRHESTEARAVALKQWRQELSAALAGGDNHPLLTALADTVREYSIPAEYLYSAIDGVEMDLNRRRYETFADLEDYCYHVASAVGLACLHIWGFSDRAALTPARQCGIAFQLTNILRDVWPDAEAGRVYLPVEDLLRFGCSLDGWPKTAPPHQLRELLQFEIARTEEYYEQAAELQQYLLPDGQRIFAAMLKTYRGLLRGVQRRDIQLSWPVRLSRLQKLWFLSRSWIAGPPRPKSLHKLAGAVQK